MNNVNLIGRLTRDPEVKGEDEKKVAHFSIAVDKWTREGKSADFPNCVAFGRTAKVLQEYTHRGTMVGIEGRLTTSSYTNKDGKKVYTTEVTVNRLFLLESKKDEDAAAVSDKNQEDDFMKIPETSDEQLPFA